ncbi:MULTISPECIES: hypothetical protein [unclassified Kribbella]|uniref:hypothetical protein n=1 Tax=unclassified Kribbella TaxID=2644121 RepID=UPI00301B49EF
MADVESVDSTAGTGLSDPLRSLCSGTVAGTVGFEEELLLVGRESWLPVDVAAVVAGIGDPRVKPELPACQLEIATSVHENVAGAVEELRPRCSRQPPSPRRNQPPAHVEYRGPPVRTCR